MHQILIFKVLLNTESTGLDLSDHQNRTRTPSLRPNPKLNLGFGTSPVVTYLYFNILFCIVSLGILKGVTNKIRLLLLLLSSSGGAERGDGCMFPEARHYGGPPRPPGRSSRQWWRWRRGRGRGCGGDPDAATTGWRPHRLQDLATAGERLLGKRRLRSAVGPGGSVWGWNRSRSWY